jgi:UDPglucose--hexose-1-phosphate uridylyltransferase
VNLGEIRKDYFTDKVAIISPEDKFKDIKKKSEKDQCSFCPGNERNTPPADLVLVKKEGAILKLSDIEDERVENWNIRVFPCESPIVTPNASNNYSDGPLYSEPSFGYHHTIVATPNHDEKFTKMSLDQWENVLSAIQDRIRWLNSKKGISYIAVFLNQGSKAGANHDHPHLQIITLPCMPPFIEQEANSVQKNMRELGVCPMCRVLSLEAAGPRQILTMDHFIAFSPWVSSHAYEFWIVPKQHETSILKITQKSIGDLALIIRSTLGGMAKALNDPSFNLVFHISSEKKSTKQLHWHIEIYPQVNNWTGLDLGMGIHSNKISPEKAASILGEASRKELAKLIGIE